MEGHKQRVLRVLLSYYVCNGVSAALGLLLVSAIAHLLLGATAAGAASIGVIVCIPPDMAAPVKGKFWHVLPAAVVGIPLFFAVQTLRAEPLWLGLLLVPASFVAFLAGAWGKRGLPLAVSMMFAMVFSMALPTHTGLSAAVGTTLHFALGATLYLLYATAANARLNPLYRKQMLADSMVALAHLMRTQAEQFLQNASADKRDPAPLIGVLLHQQAALTDQLQAARDIVLESPGSLQRQRQASILLSVLEMRDHQTACELDLAALHAVPGNFPGLQGLSQVLRALAQDMEDMADALLQGCTPLALASRRPALAAIVWEQAAGVDGVQTHMLARGLANRVGNFSDEVVRINALARGEAAPDIDLIRSNWSMFVSSTAWSWKPFVALWRWDAPPLRHAVRAALAIGFAYVLGLVLPWGTHDYWILLTIVVVLRGSLAQTLERRNSRVVGTLIGCLLAGLVLAIHTPVWAMVLVLGVTQALAHAFALRRYLVTAIAATVLGLLQAHMVNAAGALGFDVLERIADTLMGVSIAWAFSYVLPSWERGQVATLVARALAAQARYARISLTLGQVVEQQPTDAAAVPELEWRLARRECYETLSALVQATQRALLEPRAVQPPLAPLGRLLARSYQLLAQLTTIKTMLLMRRERLQLPQLAPALRQTAQAIDAALLGQARPPSLEIAAATVTDAEPLPDPFQSDLTPWMRRRLGLSLEIAGQLREELGRFDLPMPDKAGEAGNSR
jgi:uncharacterized membrane protein YccC